MMYEIRKLRKYEGGKTVSVNQDYPYIRILKFIYHSTNPSDNLATHSVMKLKNSVKCPV